MALLLGILCGPSAAQENRLPQPPPGIVGTTPRSTVEGVFNLLAYSVVPDSTAGTLQMAHSNDNIGVISEQLGAGPIISKKFLLYLEGYLGNARDDPRTLCSAMARNSGTCRLTRTSSARRWDVRLTENLYLRPS